jgi:hypothetical protein
VPPAGWQVVAPLIPDFVASCDVHQMLSLARVLVPYLECYQEELEIELQAPAPPAPAPAPPAPAPTRRPGAAERTRRPMIAALSQRIDTLRG